MHVTFARLSFITVYTAITDMLGGRWVIHIQQLNKRNLNKLQWRCFHLEEYQMFLLFQPLDMGYLLCDLWKEKDIHASQQDGFDGDHKTPRNAVCL